MIGSNEMAKNRSSVTLTESLQWPAALKIPSKRFRLFVAADVRDIEVQVLADFGAMALKNGMVYFCAWGPDCERFHDIVDELIVADDLGQHLFAGPSAQDTVMTTWHDKETLEDAVDFFTNAAFPSEGFLPDSNYWVAICLQNKEWEATIREQLQRADLSTEAKSPRLLREKCSES